VTSGWSRGAGNGKRLRGIAKQGQTAIASPGAQPLLEQPPLGIEQRVFGSGGWFG
jgi:hypothetical protein